MSTTNDPCEEVSGHDDLFWDVILRDNATGAPLTAGTVTGRLAQVGTTTALGAGCDVTLTHAGAGRWTGVQDDADFAPALPAVGVRFDRILLVQGMAARLLGRCRRVAIVDDTLE